MGDVGRRVEGGKAGKGRTDFVLYGVVAPDGGHVLRHDGGGRGGFAMPEEEEGVAVVVGAVKVKVD